MFALIAFQAIEGKLACHWGVSCRNGGLIRLSWLSSFHPHDHTGGRHSDSHVIVCLVTLMCTMHEVDMILTDATFAT